MRIRIQKNHSAGQEFKVLSDAFLGNVTESEAGKSKNYDENGELTYEGDITRGLYIGDRSFDLTNQEEWGMSITNETKEPLREIANKVLGIAQEGVAKGKDFSAAQGGNRERADATLGAAGNIVTNVAKIWYTLSGRRFDGRALGKKLYTSSNETLDFKFELYITPYGDDMQTITQNYVRDLYFIHSLCLFGKDEEVEVDLDQDTLKQFQDYLENVDSTSIAAADYQNKNEPEGAEGDDTDKSVGSDKISSVQYIFLHCTDSEYGTREVVKKWHLKRKWDDIGYNWLIPNGFGQDDVKLSSFVASENGKLVEGRYYTGTQKTLYPNDSNPTHYAVGAQVENYNSKSLGISCVGTFKDNFTIEQLETLRSKVSSLIPTINKNRLSVFSNDFYKKNKDFIDGIVTELTPYLRKLGGTIKNPSYRDLYNNNTYLLIDNKEGRNLTNYVTIRDKYESTLKLKLPVIIGGHNIASSKTCPIFDVQIFMQYVSDPSPYNKVNCIRDRWGLILPNLDGLNRDETTLQDDIKKKANALISELNSSIEDVGSKLTLRDLQLYIPGYSQNAKTGVAGSASKTESSLASALNSKMYNDIGKVMKSFEDFNAKLFNSVGLLMITPPYINIEVFNTGRKVEKTNLLSGEIEHEEMMEEDMLFQLRNMLVTSIDFEYSNVFYKYQSQAGEGYQPYGSTMKTKQIDRFLIPSYIKVTLKLESSVRNPFEVYIDQFRLYDILKD